MAISLVTNIRKISGPTQWDEMTVDDYQKVYGHTDIIRVCGILYKQDYDNLFISQDETIGQLLIKAVQFIYSWPDFDAITMPSTLFGLKVPKDIGSITFAQMVDIRKAMEAEPDRNRIISRIASIVFQPALDKAVYDSDKAEELEKHILTLPVMTIAPISFFFISKQKKNGLTLSTLLSLMISFGMKRTLRLLSLPALSDLRYLQTLSSLMYMLLGSGLILMLYLIVLTLIH